MNIGTPDRVTPKATRWVRWTVLGAVCALVIGIFVWCADSGTYELWGSGAEDTYYNLLVKGFRAGQLNVKREPPVGLAQLADPYNPKTNSRYLMLDGYPLSDMSYYRGKLYLYFGVTPALVLFWPYAALTGHYLLHKEGVVIFCTVGFLASVGLLMGLWRRYFAGVSFWVVVAGVLGLGIGTGMLVAMSRSDIQEVTISCGFALTLVALVAIWLALHEPGRRGRWLGLASLAYGLAVGSRPSLALGALFLLVPVVQVWRERGRVWVPMLAAVGPITLIGLGLMLYNMLRFHNPFEFGWHFQLITPRQDTVHAFSWRYLWFNWRIYFLAPARWSGRFPYVHDVESPVSPVGHLGPEISFGPFGILSNIPLVWMALAAPLAWRARSAEARPVLCGFVGALVLQFAACALTLGLFFAACVRYEMEFLPALMLLAIAGVLGLERALAGQPVWRRAVRCGWILLLAFSMAFNLFVSVARRAETHNNLGYVLFEKGQIDPAIAHYQKALETQPGFAQAHYNLGIALVAKGHIDEAISHYRMTLEIQPDFTAARNNLGNVLLQEGQLDEAIAQYQKALGTQHNDAAVHLNLGKALLRKGQVDEAITHFRKVLEIQPGFAEANYNLGTALLGKGQVDEAIACLQSALETQPNYAEAHNNLGSALRRKGRVDEAIVHYQAALKITPGFANAHYNLGNVFLQKGQAREAIAQFRTALELEPGDAMTDNNLGNALLQDGRAREAVACFQKALELQPGYAMAQRNLAWVLATCPEGSMRDGVRAVGLAEQANRLTGANNPVILQTLAAAYAEAGRFPEAVTVGLRVLQLVTTRNDTVLVDALHTQLALYQAGLPFRDTEHTNTPTLPAQP